MGFATMVCNNNTNNAYSLGSIRDTAKHSNPGDESAWSWSSKDFSESKGKSKIKQGNTTKIDVLNVYSERLLPWAMSLMCSQTDGETTVSPGSAGKNGKERETKREKERERERKRK